ncbi:putative phosphoadenosine phosphosulfate reductase [Pelagibacter phage HTVC034P]|nr:putative phosphoadenosine phosphosulfate reductase [Pelagibacter phage HTVC034P]
MEDREKILTVISLGAGVQSSAMAIMAAKGDLPPVDCAIFADTGYEPKMVYAYLDLLKKILPFPIHLVSKGNIKTDMLNSIENGTRFPTAPFFTKNADTGKKGMLRRQCTNDYKIQPIRQKIRKLCNVAKGKHFPKDKYVEQWIGISTDEAQRMKPARDKYILNRHPLIEANLSRQDCLDYLKKNDIPLPEKSACIVCPYHNDAYWHFMKTERPSEFADAVDFDKKIRQGSRSIKDEVFLHRKCIPLDEVEFNKKETDKQLDMFNNECEGMCGV